MREINITPESSGQRFDKFLLKYLDLSTKANVYKMLRKRIICLNGGRAEGSEILAANDVVTLFLKDETLDTLQSFTEVEKSAAVSVVYEDENILICDKPAGLLSHKSKPDDTDTLIDRILYHLAENGSYDPRDKANPFVPGLVNRLDRNTSGITVCAKNLRAAQKLSEIIAEGNADKYYLTVAAGQVKEKQLLVSGYSKDEERNRAVLSEGSDIKTEIEPLSVCGDCTLLRVRLITGKSHQIRAHLAHIGHPILGDAKYGDKKVNEWAAKSFAIRHQILHAHEIRFMEKKGALDYLYGRKFSARIPKIFSPFIKD